MTKQEADALLVLAPGVFIRAGVHCPRCGRLLHPQPKWHSARYVIGWAYDCPVCGPVLDGNLSGLMSLEMEQ